MGDVTKVLGQLAAAATTDEELYQVPNLTMTTVSSLVVCNRTAVAKTFRVRVGVNDAAASNEQYLFYDTSIAGNTTMSATLGLTLNQYDTVDTYASAAGLSFSLFGVETT